MISLELITGPNQKLALLKSQLGKLTESNFQ